MKKAVPIIIGVLLILAGVALALHNGGLF